MKWRPIRSPWSNEYNPPLPDGAVPSARLRKLEIQANEAFDTYREMYFEGGISSAYFWDLEKGFAAVILIKKGTAGRVGRREDGVGGGCADVLGQPHLR